MKIDVEGHEEKVINGGLKLLSNNNILLYLETNNQKLLKKLEEFDFKVYPFSYKESNYSFNENITGSHYILKNF